MTAHDPKARRRSDGWVRWYASCDCGWTAIANGKDDADKRAAEHTVVVEALDAARTTHCECYDPDTMEYGIEKCPGCRLNDAVMVYRSVVAA